MYFQELSVVININFAQVEVFIASLLGVVLRIYGAFFQKTKKTTWKRPNSIDLSTPSILLITHVSFY